MADGGLKELQVTHVTATIFLLPYPVVRSWKAVDTRFTSDSLTHGYLQLIFDIPGLTSIMIEGWRFRAPAGHTVTFETGIPTGLS